MTFLSFALSIAASVIAGLVVARINRWLDKRHR